MGFFRQKEKTHEFGQVVKSVLAGSLMAFGFANAADYPDHPINGVIAWGAGGGTDTVSRLTTPLAEKALGKPIILANKTGATGAIAAQAVASGKADGYTLCSTRKTRSCTRCSGCRN